MSDTKQNILDTAFQMFVESSYDEVTITDVAEEAGVSKGAVFHHFDSKYELATFSMMNYVEKIWMPKFGEIMGIDEPEKRLERTIDYTFDFFMDNPKFVRFFIELYEKSQKENRTTEDLKSFYEQLMDFGEDIFAELDIEHPKVRSHIFIGALDGLGLQILFYDSEDIPEIDSIKEEMKRVIMYKDPEVSR